MNNKHRKSWADEYVVRLQAGETIEITANGNSMRPVLVPGQIFTLKPTERFILLHLTTKYALANRVVLVTASNGVTFLHRVQDVVDTGRERWYHIANCGGTNGIKSNGWVTEDQIHGVLVDVREGTPPTEVTAGDTLGDQKP